MNKTILSKKGGLDLFRPTCRSVLKLQDDPDHHAVILDNLLEGILVIDPLGRVRQTNATMCTILGRADDEIIHKDAAIFLDEYGMKSFRRLMKLSERGRPSSREFAIIRKDGSKCHALIRLSPLRTHRGPLSGFFLNAIDITRRKHTEQILKRTEEKYRGIFENAVDGIFQVSPEGRMISANPALARIFGYTSPREFMLAVKNVEEQIYVDREMHYLLRKLLQQQGIVHDFEFRARKKDGREIWICQNVRAVRNETGHLLFYEGTLRDITSRKDLEDQLLQSQKMEAIGRLAGGIAHDFNNILTTVIGNAELAMHQLTDQSPVQKRINIIVETAERAAQLTRQLLTISRKQVISPVILNVNDAVDNVGKILDRLLGEDVKCEIQGAADLRPIRADASQIEQVVLNLAVNAREAMPNGGKLDITTAMVQLNQDYCRQHPDVRCGDYAMISVSDTGVGIPGATLEHIFEPFYTTKASGTGLGLSIVYGIVKQCGGHITIESAVGSGSTFKVFFPCVFEVERKPETSPPMQERSMPAGKETILIVEDEASIRELTCDVLLECGYTVYAVATAEEAIREFNGRNATIDLLISDVILPGKRGPDLAEGLKASHPDMKVIFMSGYSDDRIRHSDILEGRAYFLPKPFTPLTLANTVREILESPTADRSRDNHMDAASQEKEE